MSGTGVSAHTPAGPERSDFIRDCVERIPPPSHQDRVVTMSSEHARQRGADARRRAGNHRDLSPKITHDRSFTS